MKLKFTKNVEVILILLVNFTLWFIISQEEKVEFTSSCFEPAKLLINFIAYV